MVGLQAGRPAVSYSIEREGDVLAKTMQAVFGATGPSRARGTAALQVIGTITTAFTPGP